MDGLQQASDAFRGSFRKTARGMAKPQWKDADSLSSVGTPSDLLQHLDIDFGYLTRAEL